MLYSLTYKIGRKGMLKNIMLRNVGSAPELALPEMGSRLNLISGDNGLGKSFLLDTAWWILTRKWPSEINPKLTAGKMAHPRESGVAEIHFTFTGKTNVDGYTSTFDRKKQAWTGRVGRLSSQGLVLYAMANGSFALWDPARNYWTQKGRIDVQERQPAYVFNPNEVWDGLKNDKAILCNGLISDWASWQREKGPIYDTFCSVLAALSPSETEKLIPGKLLRLGLDDIRDIPSLKMPYGQDVSVLHSSSGIRRIISLAYFLVWAWEEHRNASLQLDQQPTSQMILLIDEIESHLHPKWQRRIIPSLLKAVQALGKKTRVQIVAATHSPLIMASAEPLFDAEKDAWFDFDIVGSRVRLVRRLYEKKGDILNWLTSEVFDLKTGRAEEYEELLNKAASIIEAEEKPEDFDEVNTQLVQVLNPGDGFLFRWRYLCGVKGWS